MGADDGSIVIEATEALSAFRTDGLDGTLTALWRQDQKDNIIVATTQLFVQGSSPAELDAHTRNR